VKWIYNTNTIEMPSSPVAADGRIIINNWGGVFCLSENGKLLWKNEDVVGSFTPAIGPGKVLIGGKDGFLYCLNITNGEQKWKTQITVNPGISGVTSPPTIVRGKVYIGSFNFSGGPGALYCIDETTGSVLWKNTTYSSVYFSSPAFSDNRVYIGTMGLYDSSTLKWNEPYGMYCFDANNGDLLWQFSVDGSVGSSPTIADGKVLFTSKDGYLYCLDITSGELIWKKNIGSSVSSPAVDRDYIYVGSGDMGSNGQFYCLDMDGNTKWQFTPNGAVQSSPAISWIYVYFSTNVRNGTVYCLDNRDGDLEWEFKPWPEDYIISSPAIVGSNVYFTSDNGRLYVIHGFRKEFEYVRKHVSNILYVGEDVGFHHNYEYYTIRIVGLNTSSVSIVIDTWKESVDVSFNEPQLVDTDGDGKKDLGIMLNDVNLTSQKVSLTLYPYSEPKEIGINMIVVSILAMFLVGLVIMGIIILVARRVSRKTGAPESGKKKKKDSS
jgi:outer membrane protein assembly factor BamB